MLRLLAILAFVCTTLIVTDCSAQIFRGWRNRSVPDSNVRGATNQPAWNQSARNQSAWNQSAWQQQSFGQGSAPVRPPYFQEQHSLAPELSYEQPRRTLTGEIAFSGQYRFPTRDYFEPRNPVISRILDGKMDYSRRDPAEVDSRYMGGFHRSTFDNIGIPSGDIGLRGNAYNWRTW